MDHGSGNTLVFVYEDGTIPGNAHWHQFHRISIPRLATIVALGTSQLDNHWRLLSWELCNFSTDLDPCYNTQWNFHGDGVHQ